VRYIQWQLAFTELAVEILPENGDDIPILLHVQLALDPGLQAF
jgi:hypothetical protein